MKRYIRPVARQAGITKNIGWHAFRHSFGTLLKANGEDVKTVQELLRQANCRITLDVHCIHRRWRWVLLSHLHTSA
jgi:site-specific recombinase XerD